MKEGDLVAGRYRLLRRIGAGAMGTVWAAQHELLDRRVALKVATLGERDARPSPAARELFLREVRIVAKLRHPNVVDIDDAGEADGVLYLAMELLEGESLAQRILRGPLPPIDALTIAAGVCRGLAAAHAAGVVHRDVKPENVFLARTATGAAAPKLLDFGVSSARTETTINPHRPFGTPAYMTPEQANGERVADPRADLWALGVILYEMLTARLPFAAPTYPALLPLIIEASYPPLPRTLPAAVRTVVAGCLAKDRSDRYPTADALLEAIDRARAALPATGLGSTRSGFFGDMGRTAPPTTLAPPPGGGRTARFGLVTAILALPVAIGIAALGRGLGAPSPARPAADAPTSLDPAPPVAAPPASPEPLAPPTTEPAPSAAPSAEGAPAAPEASASAAPEPTASPRSAAPKGAPLAPTRRAPRSRSGGR